MEMRTRTSEVVDRTLGNDQSFKLLLLSSLLHDLRLNSMGCNNPEYQNRLHLAYPMRSILSLSIHLRILKNKGFSVRHTLSRHDIPSLDHRR